MGVFKKKPEVVDARQFDGERQNGLDLVLWIQSNQGKAEFSHLDNYKPRLWVYEHFAGSMANAAFPGDWIVCRQSGQFEVWRKELFEETYEQQ